MENSAGASIPSPSRRRRLKHCARAAALLATLSSCATGDSYYKDVDELEKSGKYDEAIARVREHDIEKSSDLDTSSHGYMKMGDLEREAGRAADAVGDYRAAISLVSHDTNSYGNIYPRLVAALVQLGQMNEAAQAAEEAMNTFQNSSAVYDLLHPTVSTWSVGQDASKISSVPVAYRSLMVARGDQDAVRDFDLLLSLYATARPAYERCGKLHDSGMCDEALDKAIAAAVERAQLTRFQAGVQATLEAEEARNERARQADAEAAAAPDPTAELTDALVGIAAAASQHAGSSRRR